MAQEPSDEMKRYMRELQKLVYEHGYQSGTLSNRHFSQKELAEYTADLKYYEKIYPQYSWKNLNHTQPLGKVLKGKGIDIGVAYRREEAKKKGFFKNVDEERIREIEQKFTQPNMRGFFPEYEQGDRHSRVFTSFDVETDDKGHILTIAGHKVQYNYSKQRMENADVPNPTWYRAYTPANADIRATEATHHLNIPILSAIRNKLKASYSDTFNANERNAFLNWAGNSTLFGHNIAEADLPWIFNKARGWNTEIGFKKPYIDTLQLSRALFKGQPNSLDKVATRFGVGFEQLGLSHHQAEADVVVTARLLEKLVQGNASIRNNFDIDNIQSNAYNERNVVRGGSGLFHKIGGKLVMSDVYDNEDATRAELENELRFNPDTSFHIDEPGFAAGSANDYAMSRVADAAEAVQQLVSNNRVNIHYNNRDRAVQSVIRDLKSGKMTSAYIYSSVATNWGDLFDKSQQNAIVSEALKRVGLDETALTGASLRERLQRARFDYAKRIGASRRNNAYWQNSENNKFDRIMRGEGTWDDLRGMPNHLKKTYASGWSNDDLEKAINSRRRLNAIQDSHEARVNAKQQMLNSSSIAGTDRLGMSQFVRDASMSVDEFADRLGKLEKNLNKADEATKEWDERISKTFGNLKGPGWYDWTQIGQSRIAGTSEIQDATMGLFPRFMRAPLSRMYAANIERMQAGQARGNAVYNILSQGLNMGGQIAVGLGGITGNPLLMGVGAAAQFGTQVAGNLINSSIQKENKETAAKINYLGSAVQLALLPLNLFSRGLRGAVDIFKKLGNIWGTQYGTPFTFLTGVQSPSYSAMLQGDRFFGMQAGTLNSMQNSFSLQQAGLYTSGRFDQNRLVAAARLGVFSEAYAPMGGNGQAQYATMVNKLSARMANASDAEKQQMMFLMNDLDPNMMNIVQRLSNYNKYLGKSIKFEDYQSGKAWGNTIWRREFTNREDALWSWTAGEWGAATQQFNYGLKRLATPLWSAVGRPVMNTVNSTLSKLEGAQSLEDVTKIFKDAWGQLKADLNLDDLAARFKNAWSGGLSVAIETALNKGLGWLKSHEEDIADFAVPIIQRFKEFLNSIKIDPIHGIITTKTEEALQGALKQRSKVKDSDKTVHKMGGEVVAGVNVAFGVLDNADFKALQDNIDKSYNGDPRNSRDLVMKYTMARKGMSQQEVEALVTYSDRAFWKLRDSAEKLYNNTLGATTKISEAAAEELIMPTVNAVSSKINGATTAQELQITIKTEGDAEVSNVTQTDMRERLIVTQSKNGTQIRLPGYVVGQ